MSTTDLAASGIAGLDDILRGGFPRERMYLVKGRPGAGKTTLALQFLLEGVARGERCLYVMLSETLSEIQQVADSHGWSLDGLDVHESKHRLADRVGGQYTMFHPSEVELQESMQTILERADAVKPSRIVIDSLSEVRLLAQEALRYRRQMLELKQHFSGKRCTMLLLDDESAQVDTHLESLAHGVIALDRTAPVYGGTRRRCEIVKLRGVKFRDGYHDYTIERGGLVLYPRLVAAEHRVEFDPTPLPSGVEQLDALLGGGLEPGTATLLVGPAGAGKSALSLQYAVAAARAGQSSAVYIFDENVATLLARSDSMGMPVREYMDRGLIRITQVDPAEMSPGQLGHDIRTAVERDKARVIVIDSLTGYLNAMPEERYLLNQLHELLAFLGRHGVVTLLVATQHGLIGTPMQAPVDVSYLADTVILLRYFESSARVRNAISILKKRSGRHERTLRELVLSNKGIAIGEPLSDFQGVLTGVPTYTGSMDPLLGGRG